MCAGLGAYDLALETALTGLAVAKDKQPTSRLGLLAHVARIGLERGELGQAQAAIEQGEGDPFAQARPNSARLLRLVSGELALRRGNAREALAVADGLLAERRLLSAAVLLDALILSAGALRALGQDAQAREVLQEARLEAERLGSRRALWRILYALGQLEVDPSRARELRQQAQEIITYIAEHIDAPELRRSFLAQPGVRAVP